MKSVNIHLLVLSKAQTPEQKVKLQFVSSSLALLIQIHSIFSLANILKVMTFAGYKKNKVSFIIPVCGPKQGQLSMGDF